MIYPHETNTISLLCIHCGRPFTFGSIPPPTINPHDECPVRLRAELDRIANPELWPESFTSLERTAMEFASTWVRRAPYAAGLLAITNLKKAAVEHAIPEPRKTP